MNNFTKSIVYSGLVVAAGLVAIFAIYNNMQTGGSMQAIEPAAGQYDETGANAEGSGSSFQQITDEAAQAGEAAVDATKDAAAAAGEAVKDAAEGAADAVEGATAPATEAPAATTEEVPADAEGAADATEEKAAE